MSKKKGHTNPNSQNTLQTATNQRLNERQKEELLELRRMAEKEMHASTSGSSMSAAEAAQDDVYLKEYIDNLDELLRLASTATTSTSSIHHTMEET